MTEHDPRFRTLYSSLDEAPEPKADGLWIAVEIGDGYLRDYVSEDGQYKPSGLPYYPAVLG